MSRARAGRARQALAVAAALGALVAFTALARPQPSPSSRLSIGGATPEPTAALDAEGVAGAAQAAAADAADRPPADPDDGASAAEPDGMLRPLDPVTLADVPSTIVNVGPDEWPWPSQDGALVALRDFTGAGGHVRVLDARTLQPVATLEVDGVFIGFHGFTSDAEAVVLEIDTPDGRNLQRHPLDRDQPVTEVSLPEGLELIEARAVPLADGRVAMVVAPRVADAGQTTPRAARVLVADLVAERLVIDLALPELAAEYLVEGPGGESFASPGFAWDAVRARLYVAHADSSRVTVVDLAAGAVLADAEVGATLPEIGEEPVQRWRHAEVSPDGTRLYRSGSEFLPAGGTNRLLGLSVIDTGTLTELAYMSRVAEWPRLSPDGRWLLWLADDRGLTALMATADIGTVTLLGGRPGAAYPLGFSPDSSRVYLERHGTDGVTVFVHELPSLRRTLERRLPRDSWFDPATGLLRQNG